MNEIPAQVRMCDRCHGEGTIRTPSASAMRRIRTAAGLSLREMGERIEASAAFLSVCERGERTVPRRVLIAYEALGVHLMLKGVQVEGL